MLQWLLQSFGISSIRFYTKTVIKRIWKYFRNHRVYSLWYVQYVWFLLKHTPKSFTETWRLCKDELLIGLINIIQLVDVPMKQIYWICIQPSSVLLLALQFSGRIKTILCFLDPTIRSLLDLFQGFETVVVFSLSFLFELLTVNHRQSCLVFSKCLKIQSVPPCASRHSFVLFIENFLRLPFVLTPLDTPFYHPFKTLWDLRMRPICFPFSFKIPWAPIILLKIASVFPYYFF